jgi:hypothetical protein
MRISVRHHLSLVYWVVVGLPLSCSQGGAVLSIQYVPIGIETLTAVTSENVEQRGASCVVTRPSDVAEIKRIIASASPVARDEDMFTNMAVRVRILEKSREGGERLFAIVENHGPVRCGNANQVLSEKALADLKRLIEGACNFSS